MSGERVDDGEESGLFEGHQYFKYREILRNILPYLGADEVKIILTQVMVALKLEGVLGHSELSSGDLKMVNVIKDAILAEPSRKQKALEMAQKLLE